MKFNPKEWLNRSSPNTEIAECKTKDKSTSTKKNSSGKMAPKSPISDVEKTIYQIESNNMDITSNYQDWLNIGFAFADEFGESGRSFYHRVSQNYSRYDADECDKQYSHCLNSKGQGVTLNTFFYIAKQHGVVFISKNDELIHRSNESIKFKKDNTLKKEKLPTFPKSIYSDLPDLLKEVTDVGTSDEEKDTLLLGALTTMSAGLPNIFGLYGGKKVFPHLFTFITAKASAGKGNLIFCRQLVKPIHDQIRERVKIEKQHYEIKLAEYNENKSKDKSLIRPQKPREQMLFIPANNSSTGVYQILDDSDGKGLLFETEGDTLAQAFKSDYGNYSDGFRKAAQHEPITYYRRTDQEYVEINQPCLATLLSGTPQQISTLIPSAENGLFSRFLFYYMEMKIKWKNVFKINTENSLEKHFDRLGERFLELYNTLKKSNDRQFKLTTDQQNEFNTFFEKVQIKEANLQGEDYVATVRRLGLSVFRICMVLTTLRIIEHGDISEELICEQRDFNTALAMAKVLLTHSGKVFNDLPKEKIAPKRLNLKEKFLYNLPLTFNRQKYLEIATKLQINSKTAERYITSFVKDRLIHREKHDCYINTTIKDSEDSKDF